jgi:hypothetical protein
VSLIRLVKIFFIFFLQLVLVGCAANKEIPLGPLGKYSWENNELGTAPHPKKQSELIRSKARCNVESLKLQIPSPSCWQPQRQDCTGLTGFSAGFCRSYIPPRECDYSSVNAAKNAQKNIFISCMRVNGWRKSWKRGVGVDVSGGRFEEIGTTTKYTWYLKLGSVDIIVNNYRFIIRGVHKTDSSKSVQIMYKVNKSNHTYISEQGEEGTFIKDSIIDMVLKRL